MKRYVLDTNHMSAAIQPVSILREKLDRADRRGFRLGTCVPVLCELEAGIQALASYEGRERTLLKLFRFISIWPLEKDHSLAFGEMFRMAKAQGKALSQVDLMLAALARTEKLTILTTDKDFEVFKDISTENWLA